jgi:hypothetical protein
VKLVAVFVALAGAMASARVSLAQQSKAKPAPRPASPPAQAPAAPAKPAATGAAAEAEAAKKAAILNSSRWRRMMFELNEWYTVQPFYDKKQVEQLKANVAASVAKMTSSELEFMLEDMDAKFKLINSPEAQEARNWIGHYLTMASGKKREEMLKELPNLATMTAAQMQREVEKLEQQRAAQQRNQQASDEIRQAQVNNQLAADRAAQQAYIRQQNQPRAAYYSPYRAPAAGGKPPYSDVHLGPSMQYYIGSYGRFGVIFNPSSY